MQSGSKEVKQWTRPTTVEFPTIWHRYQVRSKDGKIYPIRIQDIPEHRFDEVIEFMAYEFDTHEPISSCSANARIFNDPELRICLRWLRRKILNQKVSLIAVLDTMDPEPEIMGAILTIVTSKRLPFPIEPLDKYWHAMDVAMKVKGDIDTDKYFEPKEHFEDFGICVLSKYYGLGISYNILLALSKMAAPFDIAGIRMVLSSKYSQASAEKAGFQLLSEMQYKDYKDEKGNPKLDIKDTQSIKYMYMKYS